LTQALRKLSESYTQAWNNLRACGGRWADARAVERLPAAAGGQRGDQDKERRERQERVIGQGRHRQRAHRRRRTGGAPPMKLPNANGAPPVVMVPPTVFVAASITETEPLKLFAT